MKLEGRFAAQVSADECASPTWKKGEKLGIVASGGSACGRSAANQTHSVIIGFFRNGRFGPSRNPRAVIGEGRQRVNTSGSLQLQEHASG
jgi:hypothetical protein